MPRKATSPPALAIMPRKATSPLALAIVGLLTAAVTNMDRAKELWQTVFPIPPIPGPPPPRTTETWTHEASRNPQQIENLLNLSKVDPSKVAANCTTGGDVHVWFQPGTGNGRFAFRDVPWTQEKHPTSNFFHSDGRIVSIGWRQNPARNFSYFEVLPQ